MSLRFVAVGFNKAIAPAISGCSTSERRREERLLRIDWAWKVWTFSLALSGLRSERGLFKVDRFYQDRNRSLTTYQLCEGTLSVPRREDLGARTSSLIWRSPVNAKIVPMKKVKPPTREGENWNNGSNSSAHWHNRAAYPSPVKRGAGSIDLTHHLRFLGAPWHGLAKIVSMISQPSRRFNPCEPFRSPKQRLIASGE